MEKDKIEFIDNGLIIEVKIYSDNIWLNIDEIAKLYKIDIKDAERFIKDILRNEVRELNNVAEFDNEVFYKIDLVLHIGYYLKTELGNKFREWATKIIKEHLKNETMI